MSGENWTAELEPEDSNNFSNNLEKIQVKYDKFAQCISNSVVMILAGFVVSQVINQARSNKLYMVRRQSLHKSSSLHVEHNALRLRLSEFMFSVCYHF